MIGNGLQRILLIKTTKKDETKHIPKRTSNHNEQIIGTDVRKKKANDYLSLTYNPNRLQCGRSSNPRPDSYVPKTHSRDVNSLQNDPPPYELSPINASAYDERCGDRNETTIERRDGANRERKAPITIHKPTHRMFVHQNLTNQIITSA